MTEDINDPPGAYVAERSYANASVEIHADAGAHPDLVHDYPNAWKASQVNGAIAARGLAGTRLRQGERARSAPRGAGIIEGFKVFNFNCKQGVSTRGCWRTTVV